ncbi:MAG: hypothetical protein ABW035_12145 [Acidimicrobiales bacterium]
MDEQPSEPTASDHAEVDYELDEWSTESRELLDRLLTTNDVNHAWQGGTLSVAADHQRMVEELIGEVEATLLPALDPEAEKVVYEVAEWSPEDRADLTDALADEGVRYVFDDMGDLVVEAIDEDRVDTLIDELTEGEDVVDEDIPEATEVLSGLFVAADKLRKSPRDGKAILAAREQAEAVIALPAPYGFERRTWAQIGLRAGALRVLLEEDAPDDEVVSEAAEALRDLLHPMV